MWFVCITQMPHAVMVTVTAFSQLQSEEPVGSSLFSPTQHKHIADYWGATGASSLYLGHWCQSSTLGVSFHPDLIHNWLGSKTVTASGFTTVPIWYINTTKTGPSSKIFPVQRRADTTSRFKKAIRTICHEKWKHCLAYGKRIVSFCFHRFIACILYILLVGRAGS